MTEQIFHENPGYDRAALEDYLHSIIAFDKLILTPKLHMEETGHVDLLAKLVNQNTIFIAEPGSDRNAPVLRRMIDLFQTETNAKGEPYTIWQLPRPALYRNWLAYAIHRSYTNALTINGRVLLPVYGIAEDEQAIAVYQQAMPGYEIIPIDCKTGVNGGGAVHCMTKEIPKRLA